jgi:2'-5' RNA ligase
VRLFVALDIPEEIRRRIADLALELRRHAPKAGWARTDGAHLTLKFIGERPAAELDSIRSALDPVRTSSPIEIAFRGAGFFENERRPRVLWAGVQAPEALHELAADIERRLAPLGIPPESRAFHPHITLARFDRPSESGDLPRMVATLAKQEFGSTISREFHLYESRLTPKGPLYTRLATVVFASDSR